MGVGGTGGSTSGAGGTAIAGISGGNICAGARGPVAGEGAGAADRSHTGMSGPEESVFLDFADLWPVSGLRAEPGFGEDSGGTKGEGYGMIASVLGVIHSTLGSGSANGCGSGSGSALGLPRSNKGRSIIMEASCENERA